MKEVILFDLDQTLIDSSQVEQYRKNRNWKKVMMSLDLVKSVSGTDILLTTLKDNGFRIGLVTSSPKHYAIAICDRFNWLFDVVVAYHDTVNHKPHPEPLQKAIQILQANAKQCIYVGDHTNDALAAQRAGIEFIRTSVDNPIRYDTLGLQK